MTFDQYLTYFDTILAQPEQYEPYRQKEYFQYAKLNQARMNRWLRHFTSTTAMQHLIAGITEEQHWIVITEPWCGDAAHSLPQLYQMVKDNPCIDFDIHLRDGDTLIEDYLTNGGKSIPKLIIRNEVGHDKVIWGPRPQALQQIFEQMRAEKYPFAEINETLQKWYNQDKGEAMQQELLALLA